jgi:hypothetical protein
MKLNYILLLFAVNELVLRSQSSHGGYVMEFP